MMFTGRRGLGASAGTKRGSGRSWRAVIALITLRQCNALTTTTTTPVSIPKHPATLSHSDNALFVGSCFGENIFEALRRRKFSGILSNPQGIAFNPISLASQIKNSLTPQKVWTEADLTRSGELLYSYNHHTSFTSLANDVDKESMLARMNEKTRAANELISQGAKLLFITLGTARVHVHKADGNVVSNCHKQPSHLFESRVLTVQETVNALADALSHPALAASNIILTVSPIRHTREGIPENSHSKSVLRVACTELCSRFPRNVRYFPSYEIVMDELRDYRYYEQDLIHPNAAAQEHIFSRFKDCFLSQETISLCEKIDRVLRDVNHRVSPALVNSIAYQQHLLATIGKLESIEKLTSLSFREERTRLQKMLK